MMGMWVCPKRQVRVSNEPRFSLAMRWSVMYSQIGSRGEPWTAVRSPSRRTCGRAAGEGRASAAGTAGIQLVEAADHLVGLWAVADDVTERPDLVDWRHVVAHRVERGEIGVNVRQDGEAHGARSIPMDARLPRGAVSRGGGGRVRRGDAGNGRASGAPWSRLRIDDHRG